jgi:hypothetical protein
MADERRTSVVTPGDWGDSMLSASSVTARLRYLTAAAARGDAAALAELAEALFCSAVEPGDKPSARDVRAAVREVMLSQARAADGFAGDVADQYGDDQQSAHARMRWCRNVVAVTYSAAVTDPGDDTVPRDGDDADQQSAYIRELFWRRTGSQ